MKMALKLLLFLLIPSIYSQSNDKSLIPVKPIRSYDLRISIVNGVYYHEYNDNEHIPLNGKYEIEIMIANKNANDVEIIENGIKRRTLKYDLPYSNYVRTNIDKNGILKKGYKNGFWKTTYKNKLVKTENWNNGLLFGKYKVTNTQDNVLYQTNFGSKGNGKYKDFYYTTGILKQEGNYENGKKEGEWCDYNKQGKLIKTTKYKNGLEQLSVQNN